MSVNDIPSSIRRDNDINWHRDLEDKKEVYNIVDRNSKPIRTNLSKEAASALSRRADLVKKYGLLRAVKVY